MNFYLREKGADVENQPSALPSSQPCSLKRGAFLRWEFTSSCQAFILYLQFKDKVKLYMESQHLSKDPM